MTRDCPTPVRRRRVLVGLGAGAVALAGCSGVVDFFGDLALSDLNLFNGADRQLAGRVAVTVPDGETTHDEAFDLAPGSGQADDGGGTETDQNANFEPYDDVFATHAGVTTYDATGYADHARREARIGFDGSWSLHRANFFFVSSSFNHSSRSLRPSSTC